MDRLDRRAAGAACLLAAALAAPATVRAESLRVTPAIGIREAWTDNALSSAGDRRSDFVTTLAPAISVTGEGRRAEVALDYSLAYDKYAEETELDGVRHQGLGLAKGEVVEDLLFLDARGTVAERDIAPTGITSAIDRTLAGNRTRIAAYSVSPSLRRRFGEWVEGELSYRHDQARFLSTDGSGDEAQPEDSKGDTVRLGLASGEALRRVELGYELVGVDRDGAADLRHIANVGSVQYRLDSAWRLAAHGGYDHVSASGLQGDAFDGPFWGGGFHWVPSPVTELRASAGRRFDDLDLALSLRQRLGPRTTLALARRTRVATDAHLIADALGGVEWNREGGFVDSFTRLEAEPVASPFAFENRVFRQTSTLAAVAHRGERDSVRLGASLATRRPESGGDTRAATLFATWDHALSETLTATLSLVGSDVFDAPDAGREVRRLRARLDLAWAMNPTLTGRVGYAHLDTEPEQGSGVTENVITVGLRKVF